MDTNQEVIRLRAELENIVRIGESWETIGKHQAFLNMLNSARAAIESEHAHADRD